MKNVMLFIDGTLLYHDWNDTAPTGCKMNLEKLMKTIVSKRGDYTLKRCYYYTTKLDGTYLKAEKDAQERFLEKLTHIPRLELRFGRIQRKTMDISPCKNKIKCDKCGNNVTATLTTFIDKGTDVNLAIDMLSYAYKSNYDVALLLSRDSDFIKAVNEVKELGKDVELVIFKNAKDKARGLWGAVDDWIILDEKDCKDSSL